MVSQSVKIAANFAEAAQRILGCMVHGIFMDARAICDAANGAGTVGNRLTPPDVQDILALPSCKKFIEVSFTSEGSTYQLTRNAHVQIYGSYSGGNNFLVRNRKLAENSVA